MEFLEKNLEDIICNTDSNKLNERGLWCFEGKVFRQLKIGNYGIADVVTVKRITQLLPPSNEFVENYLEITIYELKKEKIGLSAFLQAINYTKGIKRFFERRGVNVIFNIVLIGKDIDLSGSFSYLPDLIGFGIPDFEPPCSFGFIQNLSYFTYKYEFDGIKFDEQKEYKLKDEGF